MAVSPVSRPARQPREEWDAFTCCKVLIARGLMYASHSAAAPPDKKPHLAA